MKYRNGSVFRGREPRKVHGRGREDPMPLPLLAPVPFCLLRPSVTLQPPPISALESEPARRPELHHHQTHPLLARKGHHYDGALATSTRSGEDRPTRLTIPQESGWLRRAVPKHFRIDHSE